MKIRMKLLRIYSVRPRALPQCTRPLKSKQIKSLKIRVKNHLNLGLFQILGENIEIETILGSSPKRPIPVTIGVWPGTRWFCP